MSPSLFRQAHTLAVLSLGLTIAAAVQIVYSRPR